ncbi:hypothetical protein BDV95DRAFT_577986 [Massariosphaeria phaeospora]|uniref:F-box domain-containing protein n=1 Tax=Massariosphaeria phaeospora TaxID=100035 RepID=A0A7C8I470_9PLEO|nr:hypothetical protein BDV95DRAFT_577986 [Massariosphaeria phaeospora]
MGSSPPSSPRSSSPSPFDVDLNSTASPSQDDAHTSSTESDAEGDWDSATEGDAVGVSCPPAPASATSLKGKEKAAKDPMRFLDLPVDILKEIIHQLPHTNDLTSLSLCHSALHRLTIPCIYSRFDIVWPDESTQMEPRSGVDALTFGLSTLVMGEDSFPHQARRQQQPSLAPSVQTVPKQPYPITRRRLGNYYAQFTKKFSLGNGPGIWVQDYMCAKESGKMLGTLVALAVARMINLETFVWDMPTGVLRDVWLALSSLADRADGEDCRLERLWIRWHDNSIDLPAPPPPPPLTLNVSMPPPPNTGHVSGVGAVPPPPIGHPPYAPYNVCSTLDRMEYPTFSVIPALKSLSVLDIDEILYLDEMSVLIARSHSKLRELRVGIAPHSQQHNWTMPWEGDGIQQVDYSAASTAASSIGEKRLGGILGVLVGRIHNLRHTEEKPSKRPNMAGVADRQAQTTNAKAVPSTIFPAAQLPLPDRELEHTDETSDHAVNDSPMQEGVSVFHEPQPVPPEKIPQPADNLVHGTSPPPLGKHNTPPTQKETEHSEEQILNGKLRLEVLELERVPLSVPVLLKAFDWSILTTLTLLHCDYHEQLWKILRRTFTPRSPYPAGSPSSSKAYRASYTLRSEYSLSLKKIHTNTVSPSLISFLKETLAPNTLEVLFLQEGRSYSSTVTVDAIYRGPLRRHRTSLKKLMIDSSEKGLDGHVASSSRWRRWMLNREILTFITSGRMSSLRELAISIDYKDWHHFLQRLPLIPHIRSLYIPNIADHAHGNNIDPRELAFQILDIVHLRPEIELCYMGLSSKCFEILENRPSNYDLRHDGMNVGDGNGGGYVAHDPIMSDDESEATEDEEEDDLAGGIGDAGDVGDTGSELSEDAHDNSDSESLLEDRKGPKLRVREILFYEERVEAFRRRHGVLRP